MWMTRLGLPLLLTLAACNSSADNAGEAEERTGGIAQTRAEYGPSRSVTPKYGPDGKMLPPTLADSAIFRPPTREDSLRVAAELQHNADNAQAELEQWAVEGTRATSSAAESTNPANPAVEHAYSHILWAWNDHGPCTRFWICLTYVNSVGIRWENGEVTPTFAVWRGARSAHECIQNAKDALSAGNPGLAVEWVMASQVHNPPVKQWLHDHPDAVVAALQRI